MARNVNVTFGNWRTTGANVSIQQRALDVTLDFVDASGQPHTITQTVMFPNVLAQLPASYLDQELKEAIVRWHRVAQGVDDPTQLQEGPFLVRLKEHTSLLTFVRRWWLFDAGVAAAIWAIAHHILGLF
jgi:hypothetical protein